MIPTVGMLLEVTRSHLVFFEIGEIKGIEAGELLLIISILPSMQARALRMENGQIVYITTLDILEPPTYVDALR